MATNLSWDTDVVRRSRIFIALENERHRQEKLREAGKFTYTCASVEMTDLERYTVLGEEVGEIGHELNGGIGVGKWPNRDRLRKELVEVAAVCVAWIEALDREDGK